MPPPHEPSWHRRKFLKTTLTGAGGLAVFSVLGGCGGARFVSGNKRGPAARSVPLNTGWLFGPADASAFQTVTLPHVVVPLSWRRWDPASWQKQWIYRRDFNLDAAETEGMRVFLEIDAAMTAATLFLNGHHLGEHAGGYLPFHHELTSLLKRGQNTLEVQLDSRFNLNVPPDKPGKDPRSVDFWQPGGLYREARLHIVPPLCIRDVFAMPVQVLEAGRRLEVSCTIDAAEQPGAPLSVRAEMLDGNNTVAEGKVPVKPATKGSHTVTLTLTGLENIRLWDVNDPQLYEVRVTLYAGDTALHDYVVRTGFRDARFTRKGFFLNGRRLQLFGVNRHQFFPFAGGAMGARVQRRDAEILRRSLNCNMVRCSHYPQSEAFFDACDELGLLAWEEAPGWGRPLGDATWKQRALQDVENMIRRDRNHPAIIIWGARLNETPDDVVLYTNTRDAAHRLDASRQTTGAMIGGSHDTVHFVQDVFSYNDYKHNKAADGSRQPELLPPRTDLPYFVSETVGTLSGPYKYYRRFDPAEVQQGQAEAHARVHDIAGGNARYCGVLTWSGFDYPSGSGNQYDGVKYTGVVDLFRIPKPGAAIYRAQADPATGPVIAPAFYWDFSPGSLPFEKERKAMICSNCQRLELFIDGKHLRTLHPDKERFPHLPYPPSFISFAGVDGGKNPVLRIDGYLGNQKIISRSFSSDRAQDRLSVLADDAEIEADGSDATRVEFRAVDRFGAPRPYVKGDISLTIEGPAVLLGDNPFAFEDAGGAGAVWIRSRPGEAGRIRVQVRHPVLGSATVVVQARHNSSQKL